MLFATAHLVFPYRQAPPFGKRPEGAQRNLIPHRSLTWMWHLSEMPGGGVLLIPLQITLVLTSQLQMTLPLTSQLQITLALTSRSRLRWRLHPAPDYAGAYIPLQITLALIWGYGDTTSSRSVVYLRLLFIFQPIGLRHLGDLLV